MAGDKDMMIRLQGVEPSNGMHKIIIKDELPKQFNHDLLGMIRRRSLMGYKELRVIISNQDDISSNIPLEWYHNPKM